jgi:nucleoid-associated protein EbfC
MNIQKMMKQAQKMQERLAQTQAEIAGRTVEGTSGGGRVTVTASGAGSILSIKISREVVDPNDVEMLEDLVLSAVKQAEEKARQLAQTEMDKAQAGLGLPPGLGF